MMSSRVKQVVRTAVAVLVVLVGGVRASHASTITIGTFGWVEETQGGPYTLAINMFASPWPTGLSLTGVYATYTTSNNTSGSAFFEGTGTSCQGQTVTVSGISYFQSPGLYGPGLCDAQFNPTGPLPTTITSATLQFTYDTTLGTISVDPLGAIPVVLDPSLYDPDFGELTVLEVKAISFTAAAPPTNDPAIPEPASMVLLGTGLTALVARHRRRSR